MRTFAAAIALCLIGYTVSAAPSEPTATSVQPVADAAIQSTGLPKKLSDFGFFSDVRGTVPKPGVYAYELNAPLFSDYAEKYRFWYVPAGKKAVADGEGLIDFPVGSALIKSFGYGKGREARLLETRVLVHRADGWLALPYVWNADQTEAVLKVAGKRIPVTFTDPSGEERSISYAVPNKNQCKECHSLSDEVELIGPKLRNLSRSSIKTMIASNMVAGTFDGVTEMPGYTDLSAPLENRARAYLDVNCAHCHNPQGSASNSGLFLTYEETNPIRIGINKRPVAAGRGSGNHEFAIAPGDPEGSILMYRLQSTDPGIAMPEVGRSMVHKEGAELLGEWITGLH